MNIVANLTSFSPEIIYAGGGLTTVFLIISLLISLLLLDTKYLNKYVSDMLNMYFYPLSLIFIMTVIFRAILVI